MGYLLNTESQQREMLAALGLSSLNELHRDLPESLILRGGPDIPGGAGEQAILESFEEMAAKNTVYPVIFRGAGAYKHYIPAIVPEMVNKERFKTGYTPYQAEVSQGTLQSIFEFQTMICELTGMDISNASMYDAASAAAEAVAMCKDKKRKSALVSQSVNPRVIDTIKTYSWASDAAVDLVPTTGGLTDMDALAQKITDDTASVTIQQPNFFGLFEDVRAIAELVHGRGAKLIVSVNPIAASVLSAPGECGADIVVGEGQPLGIPLSFGGPYVGFIAAKADLSRRIPGRIAGETTDAQGRRAFVLTLQAREQHIRRETASSNICSNQALMAMTASVYMACLGPGGMQEAAKQSYSKAHYLSEQLGKIPGFGLRYDAEFFHEFVTECPVDAAKLMLHLGRNGILGGLPLEGGGVLWCATEMNSRKDMDRLVSLCREVSA
ncbi:MAG: aminomethyl-transferring glycine dehydrogenase subunit GcvPA [Defluviitaleaceae bacterium]|nr:aminomethyl-transferring glycine dehydrogenase subunit GcvPA [Defluviitaleaceae bacterium]